MTGSGTPPGRTRPRDGRRLTAGALLAVVGAVLLVASLPAASAAGTTTVDLTPADAEVGVGETVAIDLVVSSADGGVGGFIAEVSLANASSATITAVEFAHDPGLSDVAIDDDGASALFGAVLMDTSDAGSVTIATVTVHGDVAGSTPIDLSVEPLADEQGNVYDVSTSGGTLQTTGSGSATPPTPARDDDDDDDELDLGGFGTQDEEDTPPPPPTEQTPGPQTSAHSPTTTAGTDSPPAQSTSTDSRPVDQQSQLIQSGGQSGFGLLAGLVIVALVVYLAVRRQE